MALKDVAADAASKFLSVLAKKGIDEVKDEKVKGYLADVWGDLEEELPDLTKSLVGSGEVVLSGKHLDASKEILVKIKEDIFALKNGEIDQIDFIDLTQRRKAALFALYQAQKKSQARPSIQHVLDAGERICEILLKHGLPFLLALV